MSLTEAVRTLVEHPETGRIHKLLYWVYAGRWENDSARLNRAAIGQILPELIRRTPSYDDLERRLYKAASVLTKPDKYGQIATVILQTCAALYPSAQSPTSLACEPERVQGIGATDFTEDALPITTIAQLDRFELRRRVMQQVPPLKVKILLFSVLRHPFSFKSLDWQELKTQSLDGWLAELTQTFPSFEMLEAKLFAQADNLKQLDQGDRVAEVVLQAVRHRTP
ncbi:hypothetical protein [Altericista sp. CCNU0014]|uniref:hypothetical protein n=1 Tax=Altericista sp. CCNU0014 TaxID=3082949 RepID=UPI00384D67AA